MYIFFFSSSLEVKLATFRNNSIRAFARFTRFSVFKSHLRSSEIITPSNLACLTISKFSLFRLSLVENWYLSVKLKDHHFGFSLIKNHFLILCPLLDSVEVLLRFEELGRYDLVVLRHI